MVVRTERACEALGGKAATLLELQSAGFPVPPMLMDPEDVGAALESLGGCVAVRSSASVEDGAASSFAGQFRSFLNLRTVAEVEDAMARCRASLQEASVLEYCSKQNIDPSLLQMSVIVQKMIAPELAGVAFTVNPVTGAEEVTIEACEGLGDALLSGRQSALPMTHPLIVRHRAAIEEMARRIQLHFGAPQDIEFAIEQGELYVLQSRPITRIGFDPSIGEWTNADFRDGGVSSTVCTPLMWSLYDFIWEDALKGYFRSLGLLDEDFQAGRMFFGRPYWNLGAVKRCLAKLPGFVERDFDSDLSVEVTYEGYGRRTPMTPMTLLRAIPATLAFRRMYTELERFDREFLAGGFDAIERNYERVSDDPIATLRTLIERDYKLTETQYFRTIFIASVAKMDFKMSFPGADYTSLVAALPEMRHLAPTRALREMARIGETDVTPLLRRFRHHSRRELDIRAPRWDEDREFVEQLLQQYRRDGSTPADPRKAYEEARAAFTATLPEGQRKSFESKLDRLRLFVWLREEMRDLSTRMYYLIRKTVREVARQTGLGDDIFFMSFREILNGDRSAIERNRRIYESYRNFKAPNEIGSRYAYAPVKRSGALVGIGASQGVARGIARVARTVEEASRAECGAILVCPFTDPGWTPVLDRVAAVVTETGGLLSHAAVICREYGIPAVLGVPGATDRIADGATIEVRGGEGSVVVIDSGKEAAA